MNKQDINKAYVSPYDQFLYQFDLTHEKTASQLKEIEKHQAIAKRRDEANPKDEGEAIWEAF